MKPPRGNAADERHARRRSRRTDGPVPHWRRRYAEENGSYGLMTLQREHVRCAKSGLVFEYPAKGGKERMHVVAAEPVRALVCALRRRRPAGQRLLAFGHRGSWRELDSADMNGYLRELFGQEVTATDFRTWHATVLAAMGLAVSGHAAGSPTAAYFA